MDAIIRSQLQSRVNERGKPVRDMIREKVGVLLLTQMFVVARLLREKPTPTFTLTRLPFSAPLKFVPTSCTPSFLETLRYPHRTFPDEFACLRVKDHSLSILPHDTYTLSTVNLNSIS